MSGPDPLAGPDVAGALRRAASGIEYDASQVDAVRVSGRRLRQRRRLAARGAVAAGMVSAVMVAAVVLTPLGLGSGGVAVSAVLECSTSGTHLRTTRVEVGRSGLPLDVRNSTPDALFVTAGAYSVPVPPGRTRTDLPLPPGEVQVRCGDDVPAALRLLDPSGVYAAAPAHCGLTVEATPADEVAVGDPSRLTLTALGGRLAASGGDGARTELLGYPQASIRTVGVLEDGRLVAVATWRELAVPGAWALGEVSACAGALRPHLRT